MTSLILTLLPVATASADEVKHSQYGLVIKMATSTEITLIDAESNESYMVTITLEDAERARNGTKFFIYMIKFFIYNNLFYIIIYFFFTYTSNLLN